MGMTKARIRHTNSKGLWLDILHDDEIEDCSFPLREDEVEAILEACQEYLGTKLSLCPHCNCMTKRVCGKCLRDSTEENVVLC